MRTCFRKLQCSGGNATGLYRDEAMIALPVAIGVHCHPCDSKPEIVSVPGRTQMILVIGATGLVGTEVCRRLRARGEQVRALVPATSSKEKIEALRSSGVELLVGDPKESQSIVAACRGVNAVISTASSTLMRQPGDSIESVDQAGQLSLVNAAEEASVDRFLFVSFRRIPGLSFPLGDAKAEVD